MVPPIVHDGHNLFADFGGRVEWLRALDQFLASSRMPNAANVARVDKVMSVAKFAPAARPTVEEYFSTPGPNAGLDRFGRRGLMGGQSGRHRGAQAGSWRAAARKSAPIAAW